MDRDGGTHHLLSGKGPYLGTVKDGGRTKGAKHQSSIIIKSQFERKERVGKLFTDNPWV